jgi:signal peptidase II
VSTRKIQVVAVLAIVLLILLVDQGTKAWVRANVPLHAALMHSEPAFFRLTYEQNTGLVNSAFQSQRWIVILAPLAATAFLLYLFRYLNPRSWIHTVAFASVLGGALGNLFDRIYFGFVTDFLQFHFHFIPLDFPWKYWPPFNVADTAICCGVVVLALVLHQPKDESAAAPEKPERA